MKKLNIDEIVQLAQDGKLPPAEGRKQADDEGLVKIYDNEGRACYFHYPLSMRKDKLEGQENE